MKSVLLIILLALILPSPSFAKSVTKNKKTKRIVATTRFKAKPLIEPWNVVEAYIHKSYYDRLIQHNFLTSDDRKIKQKLTAMCCGIWGESASPEFPIIKSVTPGAIVALDKKDLQNALEVYKESYSPEPDRVAKAILATANASRVIHITAFFNYAGKMHYKNDRYSFNKTEEKQGSAEFKLFQDSKSKQWYIYYQHFTTEELERSFGCDNAQVLSEVIEERFLNEFSQACGI